jgi:uncharacterized protein (TIGR03086 family)
MPYDSSVVVPLPPDETFALITEPERLRRWNSIAARIDLRAGGDYRWTIVPGAYATGTVQEVEPGRRLVIGWGFDGADSPADLSTVTITLEPTHDGTIVRLVHTGLPEDRAADHAQGWDHYLGRLVLAGASGDAGPDNWVVDGTNLGEIDEQKAAEAACAIAERILRQVGQADHARATPCEGFTVADVVAHLAGSVQNIGTAGGASYDEGTPDTTASLEVQIADLAAPALEAWAHRGTSGVMNAGLELPAADTLGILAVEFLVHAWDVATATGQKLEVPDVLAAYVLGLARRVVTDEFRPPSMFGPELDPGPGASPLEQLIAFTGRAA